MNKNYNAEDGHYLATIEQELSKYKEFVDGLNMLIKEYPENPIVGRSVDVEEIYYLAKALNIEGIDLDVAS